MAKFFIDRPIFAWVLAIILMMAGTLAIIRMPVAQFPAIAPPTVQIMVVYPGASAKTLEDTVTQVIEQRMTGLDHLLYTFASSESSGEATISLTFAPGTNPDIAQVQVQNKLQLAMPSLPIEVQRQGVRVVSANNNFLSGISFISNDDSMSIAELSDFVSSNVIEPLSRVEGVGNARLWGSQYAMQIWLDPIKLKSVQLMPLDVQQAIQAQNTQIPAGEIGSLPALEGQQLTATVSQKSLLQTPEQFRQILLKVNSDGSRVTLGDVARVKLGSESEAVMTQYNGKPAVAIGIQLASNANALATAKEVDARIKELSQFFPPGITVENSYDTTPFVRLSIKTVVTTLIEGIVLVFLVMYLFLQNFRATLIPTIAVPVVLLGTFAILNFAGFTINTLSMFGMVLAIGLLVDDAIVVVENVERVMAEKKLAPREATRLAMGQITSALIGITLVLAAVFVPMAFQTGSVGAIYRQFSLTIVIAMVLSVFVALTLTPALCATMLKPVTHHHEQPKRGFFGWFNRLFDRASQAYLRSVNAIVQRMVRYFFIYGVLCAIVVFLFMRIPSGFLPSEDQGTVFVQIQLPQGATQQRTQKVVDEVTQILLTKEQAIVKSVFAINGFNFSGSGQNSAMMFVKLRDWSERPGAKLSADSLIASLFRATAHIKDAVIYPINPPPILELGTANGFDFMLQDRTGQGHDKLMAARNQLLGMAAQHPDLSQVRPNNLEDAPVYHIDVDYGKAATLGVPIEAIDQTLSIAWGSSYVNQFIDKGRIKKVLLQGDINGRMKPEDLNLWHIRNKAGEMVSFSAFATGRWTKESPSLSRYNGIGAIEIQGAAAPGKSSGQAMKAMEELAAKLPPGFGFEWSGTSLQEKLSGSQAPLLYALSILVVFLCLAALYESWSIPFSVILVVPLGIIGAVLATTLRGLENDVYFQVGLLTTIGLSSKNAILIVEFAKDLHRGGRSIIDAVIEAARLRLRPIIMTSMAFVLGVLPMAISSGAGSGSQHSIGTSVIGGMLSATFLAIYFVPLFYVFVVSHFTKGIDGEDHGRRAQDLASQKAPLQQEGR